MFASFFETLAKKFRNKRYRDTFVASRVRNWIAYQIRTIRTQRGYSQVEFAKQINKPQSVISRLEDPSYGKLTLQTLLEIASTFNTALVVKFVDFASFVRETDDVTAGAMEVDEYNETQFITRGLSKFNYEARTSVAAVTTDWVVTDSSTFYSISQSNTGNKMVAEERHVH